MAKSRSALLVFGTRPEAIKMAPLQKAFERDGRMKAILCATAQHREMLDQVLGFFEMKPDYDLNLMTPGQKLPELMAKCLTGVTEVIEKSRPSIVIVQGDTATAFVAGLAAFHAGLPVAHVEAGLRTHNKWSPFPEEMNRKLLGALSDFHFAPTQPSVENLLREGVAHDRVYMTGNTSIDALLWAKDRVNGENLGIDSELFRNKKIVLMTAHRRENFGEPMKRIFACVNEITKKHQDLHFVYPVHPNPNVAGLAREMLDGNPAVTLMEPVQYPELVYLLGKCHFVFTDSGGIQEEAPSLGKPVLVLREDTERSEAVDAGCAFLVGSSPELINAKVDALMDESTGLYEQMAKVANPFGDGTASRQIVDVICRGLLKPL